MKTSSEHYCLLRCWRVRAVARGPILTRSRGRSFNWRRRLDGQHIVYRQWLGGPGSRRHGERCGSLSLDRLLERRALTPTAVPNIGAAKRLADGTFISVTGQVSSTSATDSPIGSGYRMRNRSEGIMILAPTASLGIARGSLVNVIGTLGTFFERRSLLYRPDGVHHRFNGSSEATRHV